MKNHSIVGLWIFGLMVLGCGKTRDEKLQECVAQNVQQISIESEDPFEFLAQRCGVSRDEIVRILSRPSEGSSSNPNPKIRSLTEEVSYLPDDRFCRIRLVADRVGGDAGFRVFSGKNLTHAEGIAYLSSTIATLKEVRDAGLCVGVHKEMCEIRGGDSEGFDVMLGGRPLVTSSLAYLSSAHQMIADLVKADICTMRTATCWVLFEPNKKVYEVYRDDGSSPQRNLGAFSYLSGAKSRLEELKTLGYCSR